MDLSYAEYPFLAELGIEPMNYGCYDGAWTGHGAVITSYSPTTGKPIAQVVGASAEDYETCLQKMSEAQAAWQMVPAPKRAEVIRDLGEAMRAKLDPLGKLIALEMGKIFVEGRGEVQEVIDMCEYAVGLSRSFAGQYIPSERPNHTIIETWNPLGMIGIITAFNFPCAVFGWNTCLSLVCGNVQIWKGASSTCLTTIAVGRIVAEVLERHGYPGAISSVVIGSGRDVGERIIQDPRLSLISFTGSTSVGKHVSEAVHSRFGRTILELGGNNAIIICEDADVNLAVRAAVFAAVGTAGQRCTSLRRLIVHESLYDDVLNRLSKAYKGVKIGDPLQDGTLMGPLHTQAAVSEYEEGLNAIVAQGGTVLCGGKRIDGPGNFVEPTIVESSPDMEIIKTELFVPILHVMKFQDFDEAIIMNNSVPQGLSSAIFTRDMKKVFKWIGPRGSDCGLVNVNIGTSGAEIGGAFGGEKETGGGRESGSDSWKQYCRRCTCTINFGDALPLAQGIHFGED